MSQNGLLNVYIYNFEILSECPNRDAQQVIQLRLDTNYHHYFSTAEDRRSVAVAAS